MNSSVEYRNIIEANRAKSSSLASKPAPRICMPVLTRVENAAFRSGLYEALDVLRSADDVHVIELSASTGLAWKKRLLRYALYHDISGRLIFTNPGVEQVKLNDDYDLFLAVCQSCWDLPYINAIKGWKDRCRTSVCWIEEMWASSISDYRYILPALRQFDHVFIGYRGSVAGVSDAIGKACHWLPPGIDAIRFRPKEMVERPIDVYSVGRRWDGIHEALLNSARRDQLFYIYDSFRDASDREVFDYKQHRDLYASIVSRSKFFLVAPGKLNNINETGGQAEVGYRYFEGAAAGAILVGQKPPGQAFSDLFGCSDALFEVATDGSDILETLKALSMRPEEMKAISKNNVKHILMHHDWIYRWSEIIDIAGLHFHDRMEARKDNLKALALNIDECSLRATSDIATAAGES